MQRYLQSHNLRQDEDKDNPYVSPIRSTNLSGLPPALVLTVEYDPLRDEGEQYADRLREAGVPVAVKRYDGLIHGFFNIFSLTGDQDQIKDAYDLMGNFLNDKR
jgi:acetyl esterase